jgi:hypothetical protein
MAPAPNTVQNIECLVPADGISAANVGSGVFGTSPLFYAALGRTVTCP